ncbi:MAG: cell division protein FtsZ [Bacteroidaceae bacterium]|jgi:cell division protein FtsZ|nr:cell division protein FtsZ [Bacteroidaceae bacterium]MBO5885257.1 cell division protein FtsZ [Bacteroidaceae bacterium]MBQ2457678.1 cell division protein FtsZ [Bacteroidaceae bacterium]MBQ5374253.1 cell division protein FtsZ [Bacteroidaceae bacterium]MBQ5742014.1 cell division protein FtsZ [Bacteroidaceae bacterium]
MSDNHNNSGGLSFNLPEASPSIIKVIGVGGGGGNAVNHMYREGIHDVTYVMCNTDKKALSDSPVPTHLQLGRDGLGAGNRPERGKQAALESLDEIKEMLNDGTRMVFITAGMGGGTGTGAAPIIAQCAKDAGILTVGIVTIPFKFEGMKKINQALDGVDEISKHVDALLVINNERLREIYPDLTVLNAFAKADDTLSIAARSIAEIITMHGIMNLDFQDVTTVLKDGGVAIMSTGYGEGENRVTKAIEQALNSPLLNNRDIFDSKKVLININFCGDNEQNSLMMEEMNEVNDFMSRFSQDVETKWGLATDSSLGGKVKITLLATGFNLLNVPGIEQVKKEKDIIDEAENDDRLVREGERIARYYDEITQAPRKRLHNIFIFTDDDLDNEDVIAEIDVRPTYKRTRDEVKRIREKEAATTAPSPLEDGGFIINQP